MIDNYLLVYVGTLAVFLVGVLVVAVTTLGVLTAVILTATVVQARRKNTARGISVKGRLRAAAAWPRQKPATGGLDERAGSLPKPGPAAAPWPTDHALHTLRGLVTPATKKDGRHQPSVTLRQVPPVLASRTHLLKKTLRKRPQRRPSRSGAAE